MFTIGTHFQRKLRADSDSTGETGDKNSSLSRGYGYNMLNASLFRAFLLWTAIIALVSAKNISFSAPQNASDAKKADKIRGAIIGSLLADSLALGR